MATYNIHFYNEYSLLVRFPDLALQEANRLVVLLDEFCSKHCHQWISDHIPAYESLLLVCNNSDYITSVKEVVNHFLKDDTPPVGQSEREEIIIPVCYDLRLGNDLEQIAALHNMQVETLVSCHHQAIYHIYMLGFLPGFAYMGEVDEKIATPRKPVPVPTRAGAVGIAGRQTGIYPLGSPGGWNIVGYTPIKMFEVTKPSPTALQPGKLVKFMPIDLDTYYSMHKNGNGNN